MPRTAGGGALDKLAQRDNIHLQNRKNRRSANEVTIPTIGVQPESQFPELPGKRLTPWTTENASGTDIVVGSCDEKGVFQGLVLTDVQMQVLMRYFSVAATYMPREAPPQLDGLAAQLRDGMATLVVTRGAYGRELDEGNGPARNAATPAIWDAVREARIMNPALHITCVDVPMNITGAQLSKVLVQPLSDHRELMFHEGVWYIPQVVNNADLAAKQKDLFKRDKPLWHTRVAAAGTNPTGEMFVNRKKFSWRQVETDSYFRTWKSVLTDENYVKVPTPAINRDFTGPTIHNLRKDMPELADAEGE